MSRRRSTTRGYLGGDLPPEYPSQWDDDFDDGHPDEKWIWRNQGGATLLEQNGYTKLTAPTSSGDNLRIREQPVPISDFTVSAKVFLACKQANYYAAGICFLNTSNGRVLTLGLQVNASGWQLRLDRFASVSSFNATALSSWGAVANSTWAFPLYLRMVTSSSKATVACYWSADGISWAGGQTETVSTYLGSIDRVGFFLDTNNASDPSQATFSWIRVTVP